MRHVLMLSGGEGSYFAGKVHSERTGAPPDCLFADTLIEDQDTYRFLVEAAADIRGVPLPDSHDLRWFFGATPPIDEPEKRLDHLTRLSREAMRSIPGFHWVIDGRTPWDVFHQSRFLGNTRAAKCSHVLKQDASRNWLKRNCDITNTTILLGINYQESERLTGNSRQRGARASWEPWKCEAPLCEQPFLSPSEVNRYMAAAGIRRQALYSLGAAHSNCGMFCVRAGHKQFARLLETMPGRYAFHEKKEEELRQYLGKDVAILRDRRGGTTKPFTLKMLRERVQNGDDCGTVEESASCGCFLSEDRDEQ